MAKTHITQSMVPRARKGDHQDAGPTLCVDPGDIGSYEQSGVQMALRLGRTTLEDDRFAVMAIVNRTPDSFFDKGATYQLSAALERVHMAVSEGATIVDVGGVKAGQGRYVDVDEELRRTADLVSATRSRHPGLVISVDTWRAEVARELCDRGADLINDTWAGHDPDIATVAAEYDAGLVCSHSGGLGPRTDPHRVAYDDVVADVIGTVTRLAERAVSLGVRRDAILVDPTHDFGKNTWHSLELTRRLDELVATGWPVLVALSNKDFIGETLDLPTHDRLVGTLAATAVAAWQGARVFRAHHVRETKQVLDMVASIAGRRPPAVARRGLA
jgi:dihydropteroate synthase